MMLTAWFGSWLVTLFEHSSHQVELATFLSIAYSSKIWSWWFDNALRKQSLYNVDSPLAN